MRMGFAIAAVCVARSRCWCGLVHSNVVVAIAVIVTFDSFQSGFYGLLNRVRVCMTIAIVMFGHHVCCGAWGIHFVFLAGGVFVIVPVAGNSGQRRNAKAVFVNQISALKARKHQHAKRQKNACKKGPSRSAFFP